MGYILGIDEAGRGAWAGPLVVGAVILDEYSIDGLTDSKLLSRAQRQKISLNIHERAIFAGLGWVSASEVDKKGLTTATIIGIKRAIKDLMLGEDELEIIIDGNINYLSSYKNARCLIKADLSIPAVSAAGIIAKVTRDHHMTSLSETFPNYGFDSHVGYGTRLHAQNLSKHGPCEEHRVSFKPVAAYS